MNFCSRITAVTIIPEKSDSIRDDNATRIEIDDEGAGGFVVLTQPDCREDGGIAITADDWPALRAAIERLFGEINEMEAGR